MNNEAEQQWHNLVNPETLRTNLKMASIYIAAYEILRNSVVGRIRFFFSDWEGRGWKPGKEYEDEVLSRNKSPIYASVSWLREMNAVSDADVQTFERIKALRNQLAHEMPDFLARGVDGTYTDSFADMVRLLRKIEKWWIVEFEIPINPDFDRKEIDEDGIVPGPVMMLQLMLDVALGPEQEANKYHKEIQRRRSMSNCSSRV